MIMEANNPDSATEKYGKIGSPDFKQLIVDNIKLISRTLAVSQTILIKLSQFTEYKLVRNINYNDSAQERVDKLINNLVEIPDELCSPMFEILLSALRQDGQKHVANIFDPQSDIRPMSDEHYQLLMSQKKTICKYLDPVNGVLDELHSCDVFSERDSSQVRSQLGLDEMASKLVDILSRKADSAFDFFIAALHNSGQQHVETIIRPEIGVHPMSDEHRRLLIGKKEIFKFLDPLNGVLDVLVSCEAFSSRDISKIKAHHGLEDMARETIDILSRKADSAFDLFLAALRNTGQEHVAHIITGEGEPPLSEIRRTILQIHRTELMRVIDAENSLLIDKLIETGVLSSRDEQLITAEKTNNRMNRLILQILSRKSQSAYDRFVEALKHKDIDQATIAQSLEDLEVKATLNPHFHIGTSSAQQMKVIKLVRDRLGTLLSGREQEVNEIADVMRQNGFIVSNVTDGSIHITFRCFNEESLANLKRLYEDKTLDRLFTQIFCPELAVDGLESLTLEIREEEFVKCYEKLRQITLMTPTHQHALNEAGERLDNKIVVSEDLLNKLSLTEHHKKVIRQAAGHVDQVKKLLDIISCRPDSAFTQLVNSLVTIGQSHVALKLQEYCKEEIRRLSLEMLEMVLMRAFIKLFTDNLQSRYVIYEAIAAAYGALSAVCYNWWHTLNGWPQSNTKHWLRHRLHNLVQSVCRPYSPSPRQQFSLTVSRRVRDVTYCDNKLFVACWESDTIQVFGLDNKQLTSITVNGLASPADIVACTVTYQLYIADLSETGCIWRVSLDGHHVDKWLTSKSTSKTEWSPYSLSLTSRRLLVTSYFNNSLFLFGSDGVQQKHISLPDMYQLQHAVETLHGTFVVCLWKPQRQVSEIDADGHVIRDFRDQSQLGQPHYLALDSDGRVLVADSNKHRVLLLNCRLELERVLLDKEHHQLVHCPGRLCYVEPTHQLIVASVSSDLVQVYKIS